MKGAVTASTQEAADAGVLVLQGGGNAVDAIVAAALANCVADPCNTGIGGYGGYMVVQRPAEVAHCIAFPASPPSSYSRADLASPVPAAGPGCSTVPNVVAGLARALKDFGSASWSHVSGSAIRLAEEGVEANATTRRAFGQHRLPDFISTCFEFERTDGSLGAQLRFRQPQLAVTLQKLAREGPEWFYAGPLANAAAAQWDAAGLALNGADWRAQFNGVFVEKAPTWEVGGVRFSSGPLGLSGSACLFAFLEAARRIARQGPFEEPEGLASLALAMASVWQYRFSAVGGYGFGDVALASWIDAALSGAPGAAAVPAAVEHTAHLNAVDGSGTVAALTFTHGPRWFGGHWCLPGTGVLMNMGMQNCSAPTIVRRGSRWHGVSNMSPAIGERPGTMRVAIGCPGARRIPSNIAIALARVFFGRGGLQPSVSGGRFHTEDRQCIHAESDRLGAQVMAALGSRFASVVQESDDNYFGPLTAVCVDAQGVIETAVDDRGFKGFSASTP